MSYRMAKPKQDRSFSVDISNDIIAMMHHSRIGNFSDVKTTTQGRSTPKGKSKKRDTSYNQQDENYPPSNDNSPLKPQKLNHYFGSRSQNNSAVKVPNLRPAKLERVASVFLQGPQESENPVSKAIHIAYELQAERERELSSTKERLESEILRLKMVTDSFSEKITSHRQNHNSKHENLRLLQFLSDKSIVDLDEILIQDPLKRKALINALSKINRTIIMDYRALQSQNDKRIDSSQSSSDGNISSLFTHPNIDVLQTFLDDKNLLIHKVEQAEEKLSQAREIKHMIEEDFNSHVNSTTEYVFAQEEAENRLENLKQKHQGSFELVLQNVELDKMCASLEVDYANKYGVYSNLTQQVSEEQIKHSILSEQNKDVNMTLESLTESLMMITTDVLFPLLPLLDRLGEALRLIPITSEDLRQRILSHFSIFDALGRLNISEKSNLTEKGDAIIYQNEVLEEILSLLKCKRDISNLESTMMKLQNKNQPDNESQVIKSIQSEVINKKVAMTQKVSDSELSKKKIIRQSFSLNSNDYLLAHCEESFFELSKRYSSLLDASTTQKLEQVLLILLSTVKEGYNNYFAFKEQHNKTQEKAFLIQNDFKTQTRVLDSIQHALMKTKEELNTIKRNQECYRQKQIEIKEQFEILSTGNKTPRDMGIHKEKLSSKSPTKDGSLVNTPRKNAFAKVKREIQDAYSTIQKVELMRASNSNKIETELRPAFNKAKVQFIEFKSKIGFLNKEILVLIDKEQEFFRSFEKQIYEAGLQTVIEEEYVILSRLYLSTQDYITGLCELISTILQAYFMEERPERAVSLNRNDIYELLQIQQERMRCLMDTDNKKIQEYELQLRTQMPVLQEREEKLQFVRDQLQKSKHFCEVTDQLLRNHDKENCFANSNNNSFLNSSGKKLTANKSSSKLQTITKDPQGMKGALPSESKLNIDIRSTKLTNENKQNISQFDSSSGRTLQKNYSTASIGQCQLKNNQSDRCEILKEIDDYSNQPCKADRLTPRHLFIEPDRYLDAIRDFELGFPVWKRFSATANLVSTKHEFIQRSSNPEIKGYGRRTLRVNIVQKTIEVVKINTVGSRPQVEYSYDWRYIKKLFIPQKTLDNLKRCPGMNKDGIEFLCFALDIQEKGRVDLLATNPFYIVVIWNFVNQILSSGTISGF